MFSFFRVNDRFSDKELLSLMRKQYEEIKYKPAAFPFCAGIIYTLLLLNKITEDQAANAKLQNLKLEAEFCE